VINEGRQKAVRKCQFDGVIGSTIVNEIVPAKCGLRSLVLIVTDRTNAAA